MTRRFLFNSQTSSPLSALLHMVAIFILAPGPARAQSSSAALAAYNSYVAAVESRLDRQHHSPNAFLAPVASPLNGDAHLRSGDLIIEQLNPSASELPGALLHHWRGAAFVPGATAAGLERLLRDFSAYPRLFAPQVLGAKIVAQNGDRLKATMRVRQRHVISVVLDTSYDVVFGRLDAKHVYSLSRSTRITEIDSPGTSRERALSPEEEHGFLWRQNTYWSYAERDGGLYIQVESISLSRSIPRGLGWAVAPYLESIPRDSLEFTLRSASNALRASPSQSLQSQR